jgi:RHS repeat-associated protein
LTDTSGQLLSGQAYHYSPFGEAIDHPAQPEAAHLFTGEYYDSDLSLYYLRARLYDPCLGRFTSCDPVDDQANKLHRYVYCGNDGVNAVDISGRSSLAEVQVVAAIKSVLVKIAVYSLKKIVTKTVKRSLLAVVGTFASYTLWRYWDVGTGTKIHYSLILKISHFEDLIQKNTSGGNTDWENVKNGLINKKKELGYGWNYRLSDNNLVGWDKFLHFCKGAHIEQKIGMFGFLSNLVYEWYAMRPGLFDHDPNTHNSKNCGHWGDHEKPFIWQDVEAGGFGGEFEEDWDHISNPDVDKYFLGKPDGYWEID